MWKDKADAVKSDYESRCSSLVRLSEQHKQEALKSQAILHRIENQSATVITQLSHQLSDGTQCIQETKLRVTTLTDSLLKTYKVPPELLNSLVSCYKCAKILWNFVNAFVTVTGKSIRVKV